MSYTLEQRRQHLKQARQMSRQGPSMLFPGIGLADILLWLDPLDAEDIANLACHSAKNTARIADEYDTAQGEVRGLRQRTTCNREAVGADDIGPSPQGHSRSPQELARVAADSRERIR